MPFSPADLARLRPWAYHFTAAANVPRIVRQGRLACAAGLLAAGGRPELLTTRRPTAVPVIIDGEPVVVCDQRPLHAGAIRYDSPGLDFAWYVAHLNRRVFFWPGRDGLKLVPPGARHLAGLRAAGHAVGIVRVEMAALVEANRPRGPLVSRCNSGAPTARRGYAVRGVGTFVRPDDAAFPASQVAEVTFDGFADVPGVEVVG